MTQARLARFRLALSVCLLALLGACSTLPPTARPQPEPIADERLPPVIRPDSTPRERIVDIALQEWRRWGSQTVEVGPHGACVLESSLPLAPEYVAARAAAQAGLTTTQPCLRYPDGSGMEATQTGCELALRYWHLLGREPDCVQITEGRWAWSAAFISWVMRRAGLDDDQFLTGQAHSMYVTDARDGILPQAAYRVEAFPAVPLPGDMICSARGSAHGLGTPQEITFSGTPMHCDIVVEADPEGRQVKAIGGNVQQSVSMSLIRRDDTGAMPEGQAPVPPAVADGADAPPDEAGPSARQPWLLVMRYQLR